MSESPEDRARLAIVSGPVEAIVASAAVLDLAQRSRERLRNVLVLESLYSWHDARLRSALMACAAGVDWDEVIDVGRDGLQAIELLRARPELVAEVLAVRNWNGFNPELLAMFPAATKIAYGDTYGSIDNDTRPTVPQFDAVVAPIPRPGLHGALDDIEVNAIPRETTHRVLELVRQSDEALGTADEDLARFAQGGCLMLTSCETEARRTPLRGEVAQGAMLARRAAKPGAPVVIKPHPRASLGQAAAVARRLRRRGHDVRLVPSELGYYPIELFSSLVRSVQSIQVGHSSAGIPLAYLHGLRPTVELPAAAAATFFPHAAAESVSVARYNRQALDLLADWDERGPLPVQPLRAHLEGHQVGRRPLAPRIFGWTPADDLPTRRAALPLKRLVTAVGRRARDHGLDAPVVDQATGTVWALPVATDRERFEAVRNEHQADPIARLRALLRAAAADVADGRFMLGAAVRPPTHRPRISALLARRRGVPVIDGTVLSAEELELELESVVRVLNRDPELGRRPRLRRAAPPAGCVEFVCAA